MPFVETGFPGLWVYTPALFNDNRGYFFEAYNRDVFSRQGLETVFVQDNQSRSSYGVIRGLHYQLPPYAQTKLVRVLEGKILDVVVDIRKGSPAYGKHFRVELSAENNRQLFVPHGFAHGFSVLSETATVLYKCDALYRKESEGGICYNDPELHIDWGIPAAEHVISEKDLQLPPLQQCVNTFVFQP